MAALTVEIRAKRFPALGAAPARTVLGPLRLAVEPGERVAVLGPSGCGKTTLLCLVAGLDRDLDGRIERAPGPLGFVFQEPRLLPWRTVADNLRFVVGDTPDAEVRIRTALAEVGLSEAAEVYASRLSLGMARRVALARAFLVRPAMVLLDEPFVSLDQPTAQRLRTLVLDLLDRHRTTTLLVTHDPAEAIMLADRVLVLTAAPGRLRASLEVGLDPAARREPATVAETAGRLLDGLVGPAAEADAA